MSGEMKIPAGWKSVPEVLTDAMRDAVVHFSEKAVNAHQIHELTWDNYYAVMTRASPPPPEDGWKPIESAPENGRCLLAIETDDGYEFGVLVRDRRGNWIHEGEPTYCASYLYNPTHWRELPPPPAALEPKEP